MSGFKLEQFGGMLPAWDDHLLSAGQAAFSQNSYLFSGALTGWRVPKLLRSLSNPAAKTAYRIPTIVNGIFDNSITGAATWLEFTDPFTDVMRSPVVNDTYGRYYFASPSQAPQYNTTARIQAAQSAFLLGVPAPGCAPGVSVVGGGDAAQLGNVNSQSTNTGYLYANSIYLIPVTAVGAMQLDSISFVAANTVSGNYQAALYDDQGGSPFQVLAVSDLAFGTTAGSPTTCTFTTPPGLLDNVKYWIGIMTDTTTLVQFANDNTGLGQKKTTTFSNGPPLFLSGLTTGQSNFQLYATLTTSSVLEARSYVYTWVTAYGEEGPPSPTALVNGWSNGTWTVDLFAPDPAGAGLNRNITRTRIYRTVTSSGGGAAYYFVAEQDVGLATYTDTIDDSIVALNNIIGSVLYYPPPVDLQGILAMPNGMAVGFRKNEIWFCEPYRPHAWPPSYVLTTEFDIVGIGVTGNAVVAATEGSPYIIQGVNPGQMVSAKTTLYEPCLSRGSVLGTDNGVFYCSQNGLISVQPSINQAVNVTEMWITRERWSQLTPEADIKAIRLASMYFAYETSAQDGFCVEMAADQQSFSIWPQPGGHRIGFSTLTAPLNVNVDNLLVDPWTGIGLMIANGNVYYYDFTDQAPTIQPYKWRSKIYQQTSKKNFEAMKIYFTVPPGTPAQNATRNQAATADSSWNTLQAGQYGIVRVYADGVLVTTREIRQSGELLRILSGFKAEEWQWEFEGRVLISNMQAATSAKELAGV